MHILITRPQPDADRAQKRLSEHVERITSIPLFEIVFQDIPAPTLAAALKAANVFVATSANSFRALAAALKKEPARFRIDDIKTKQCYCVGDQTANAAQHFGLDHIHVSRGAAAALVQEIQKQLNPDKDEILYLRGQTISCDIEASLRRAGFSCNSLITYRQQPASAAGHLIAKALRSKTEPIDAISFFSVRTVARFREIVHEQNLEDTLQNVTALCFSRTISDKAAQLPFRKIHSAANPNMAAFIDLIQSVNI